MLANKKGQITPGLVTGLVLGVATLVIGVIIAFTITSTMSDANLLTSGRTTTTVTNETGGYVNTTGYTLVSPAAATYFVPGTVSITQIVNATGGDGTVLLAGNYSVSSAGVVTNASATTWADVNITYTYNLYSDEEQAEIELSNNFTSGIDNVSGKIPTVLLIAAIVLIIGVLAVLVSVWQRMSFGASL